MTVDIWVECKDGEAVEFLNVTGYDFDKETFNIYNNKSTPLEKQMMPLMNIRNIIVTFKGEDNGGDGDG